MKKAFLYGLFFSLTTCSIVIAEEIAAEKAQAPDCSHLRSYALRLKNNFISQAKKDALLDGAIKTHDYCGAKFWIENGANAQAVVDKMTIFRCSCGETFKFEQMYEHLEPQSICSGTKTVTERVVRLWILSGALNFTGPRPASRAAMLSLLKPYGISSIISYK